MRSLLHRRRARWAAPVAVAGAIALGSWVATTSPAQASTPNLPKLTAAQILAKAAHPTTSDFSGTVKLTANLDLPDVSSLEAGGAQGSPSPSGFDPTTFLSGTHQIKVWAKGDDQRLSYATTLAETDLVHAGNQAWLYDSSTQKVTHWTAPAGHGGQQADDEAGAPLTPVQAAQRWLDHLDPSTTVSVSDAAYVAHRAAYNVSLSPKAGTAGATASTLEDVSISVDAATGLPLCVQVDAKGQKAPALMLQFSSLDLGTPAASNFAAPHGTSTKNVTPSANHGGDHRSGAHHPGGKPAVSGGPWGQVLTTHVKPGRDLRQLDKVSTAADGGRLIHTAVGNALVFPDGRVVVGFVTPAALEAAAG